MQNYYKHLLWQGTTTIVFVLTIFLLTQSCNKNKVTIRKVNQLWDCNAKKNYNTTTLANDLIGSWKWTKYYTEIAGTIKADKDVIVTFLQSGTFTITENSNVVTQGNWSLKIEDGVILGLDMSNRSKYLYGRILLCDNQVVFNNSYVDGADNFFERQ